MSSGDGQRIVRVAGEAPICEFIIQVPEGSGKGGKGVPAGNPEILSITRYEDEGLGKIQDLSKSVPVDESVFVGKSDKNVSVDHKDVKNHSQWAHLPFLRQSDLSR